MAPPAADGAGFMEAFFMKTVILESLGISREKLAALEKPFQDAGDTFEEYERTADPDKLVQEVGDAEAMIIANMPMPGDVIRRCPNLKYIDVAFTGVDHVGLDACREKGIAVSNASGYSNEAVAELAVGMVISLLRNIPQVDARARSHGTKDGLVGCELKGKTVGIIGLGHIGRRSAELFHAFGARIAAHSLHEHSDWPDYITQLSLDGLLQTSDIVVLHCPLNDSTRGMIDAKKLSLMKKSAILINVARGPVVVAADLADALKRGVIAGAGIDVFDAEPPIPESEPLLSAPNTLLTPHVAFATKESMDLRADIVFDNLRAWMDGRQKNVIL